MKKERILRYFVYDIINNINTTDKITIKEFKYDSKTLVNSFYRELLNIYKTINFNDLDNVENISELIISFTIIDNVNQREIGSLNADDYLLDVLTDIEDKILCIIPRLPVGATFAKYNNYKIVIHSNEDIHRNFPHVHVLSNQGDGTVIDLVNMEISEGVELTGKDKKKIFEYLEENRELLINYYRQVVEHKLLDKISIEIIK